MKNPDFPEGERGSFAADARLSPTLPSRYYHDPEIYGRELRAVFQRSWCYVGHVSELPNPGDFRVESVADQCIFLLRAEDGEIRAFYNVCQHRGHELLQGSGSRKKRIVCPYHAWTYDLDGALIQAPHTDRLQNFDAAEFSLKPVRLAICAGLLFANLDPAAVEFEQAYPGLAQTFSDSLPAIENFGAAIQLDYDIAANWKIVVDNFSEGYHIPVAHRQLTRVLEVGSGNRSRVEEHYAFFESRSGAGYEGLELEAGTPYRSWTLWPNTCLLSLPGCENLIVIRMAPDGPEGCREHVDLLTIDGEVSPTVEALRGLFAESFNQEDIAIVESVQRGLKSLGYDQGRYVVDDRDDWYSESGLHKFHRLILAALAS